MSSRDQLFLNMGIDVKSAVVKCSETEFCWIVTMHHIGPDDFNSKTKKQFDTAESAFMDMVSNLAATVNELIEDYNN